MWAEVDMFAGPRGAASISTWEGGTGACAVRASLDLATTTNRARTCGCWSAIECRSALQKRCDTCSPRSAAPNAPVEALLIIFFDFLVSERLMPTAVRTPV